MKLFCLAVPGKQLLHSYIRNARWYPLDAWCQGAPDLSLCLLQIAATMSSPLPIPEEEFSLSDSSPSIYSFYFSYPLNIWKIYTLMYKTWPQKEECVSECCMQIGMGVHQHINTMGATTWTQAPQLDTTLHTIFYLIFVLFIFLPVQRLGPGDVSVGLTSNPSVTANYRESDHLTSLSCLYIPA